MSQVPTRDVMNYKPPQGPTNINDSKSPGLHGDNCGTSGEQNEGRMNYESSGSPGIGGTNHGNCGSQK